MKKIVDLFNKNKNRIILAVGMFAGVAGFAQEEKKATVVKKDSAKVVPIRNDKGQIIGEKKNGVRTYFEETYKEADTTFTVKRSEKYSELNVKSSQTNEAAVKLVKPEDIKAKHATAANKAAYNVRFDKEQEKFRLDLIENGMNPEKAKKEAKKLRIAAQKAEDLLIRQREADKLNAERVAEQEAVVEQQTEKTLYVVETIEKEYRTIDTLEVAAKEKIKLENDKYLEAYAGIGRELRSDNGPGNDAFYTYSQNYIHAGVNTGNYVTDTGWMRFSSNIRRYSGIDQTTVALENLNIQGDCSSCFAESVFGATNFAGSSANAYYEADLNVQFVGTLPLIKSKKDVVSTLDANVFDLSGVKVQNSLELLGNASVGGVYGWHTSETARFSDVTNTNSTGGNVIVNTSIIQDQNSVQTVEQGGGFSYQYEGMVELRYNKPLGKNNVKATYQGKSISLSTVETLWEQDNTNVQDFKVQVVQPATLYVGAFFGVRGNGIQGGSTINTYDNVAPFSTTGFDENGQSITTPSLPYLSPYGQNADGTFRQNLQTGTQEINKSRTNGFGGFKIGIKF